MITLGNETFNKNLRINTTSKAIKFAKLMDKIDFKATVSDGNSTVNANSIIGLFSLDLNLPISLNINTEQNLSEDFLQNLEAYIEKSNAYEEDKVK